MDILKAFNIDIDSKGVITLVGAGGKTSTMFKIAREMKDRKKKVLVTTTTSIFYPSSNEYDNIFVTKDYQEALKGFEEIREGSLTVIGYRVEKGKMKGIPSEWIDSLAKGGYFDFILVEGDGSKGRPLKAPADYEPVIPSSTDIVIGIVGLDVLGKEINEEGVHRPEKLSRIIGKNMNDIIEGEDIIKLVLAEGGLFKDTPGKAKKILFFNKVINQHQYRIAEEIGNSIISKENNISKIVIGAIKEPNPIRGIMGDK